jgi:pimeloyl-ACP methyl ester carboxylesterase
LAAKDSSIICFPYFGNLMVYPMASFSPTIVLIHGYGFVSRIWNPVENAFYGYNVIRLSLPGFGDDKISGPYSIESLSRQFWEELSSQGESAVHLVGHCMGGYVCMEMLAQHPDRVVSLCLLHSHVFADSLEKKKARTATLEEIQSAGREAFVRRMIGSMVFDKTRWSPVVEQLIARGMMYSDEAWYNGTLAIRDRKDHTHTLEIFKGPCLMILGESDTAIPVSLGYRQAAVAERTLLFIYPNVGHLAMYENTSRLIDDLLSFYST